MSATATLAVAAPPVRPWRRAAAWLAFLTPFFFLTYGSANFIAAHRDAVGSIVFAWERHIPFVAWTIIPYWSIDALYGLSVFVCATRAELDTHGRRLLTAQIVAVACFIAFPLRFTFVQPPTDGFAGFLFATLTSFDQPFNQAPSLHIALLVILWRLYALHLPRLAQWPAHLWFALVGVSVLTTYQHHFFDVPTGALLGFLCLWLWPDREPSPSSIATLTGDPRRRVLAARYGAGAVALGALACWIGGAGLWLWWPAVSLMLVAANYALLEVAGFQKGPDGRMSLAARWLLAPYQAGVFVSSRLQTRSDPSPSLIRDDVWLGRFPTPREAERFATVIDLCAELPGGVTSPRLRGEVDRRPSAAVLGVQERRREASPMQSAAGEGLSQRPRRVESPPHPPSLCSGDLSPQAGRGGDRGAGTALEEHFVWQAFPMLDLVAPAAEKLRTAAAAISEAQSIGPVLVCCALGFSRSAAAVASWLVASGRAQTADEAITAVRQARPRVVIGEALRGAIAAAADRAS